MTKNVFVLCTGRCGSTTFTRACGNIQNYTSGHETRTHLTGTSRLDYPPNHIETDNRLSWQLGRLDEVWGDKAHYVHLTRDREDCARSFEKRAKFGIMGAYRKGILFRVKQKNPDLSDLECSLDYIDTVTSNIRHFLKDKTHVQHMRLETLAMDFPIFWHWIEAQGNLDAALSRLNVKHNASKP